MPPEIFMRFMELVSTLESASPLEELEPIEKKLLQIIALTNLRNERLSVKDLMHNSGVASPATTHKYIHAMVYKDWIELASTDDSRRKQVKLTSGAMRHFDKIGKAVLSITRK